MIQKKILIVDDDKELSDALFTVMKAAGYKPLVAQDGVEGLELARTEKPDLILLDITMPKMNGLQMLHTLRRESPNKLIPVILLTNADDPTHIVHGVELKSSDYIIKSQTSLETIVKRVKQTLLGYVQN